MHYKVATQILFRTILKTRTDPTTDTDSVSRCYLAPGSGFADWVPVRSSIVWKSKIELEDVDR